MSEDLANIKLEVGYRHVLRMAWPMILSTSSISIMHFVDRMFVAWHSQESLAASLPAAIASFLPLSFFLGTAGYVSTFVAQYCGAKREHRIGPAVWQGIYLGLVAMVLMWTLYPLAESIMNLGGHSQAMRILEAKYFRVLVLGGGFVVIQAAINGFYIGRGKMHTILAVNTITNAINIALNYCLIFGEFGFPSWGLVGAGWATVISQGLGLIIISVLFLSPSNRRLFGTAKHIGLDKDLFLRLLRYGVPAGLHFFVDIGAFTFLVFLVGWRSSSDSATTNAVFSINHLAIMPMLGFAIATSTLVGQFLGRNRPDLAQRVTSVALRMVTVYMVLIGTVFVLFPEHLIGLFQSRQEDSDPRAMLELGRTLLLFVASFCLVDGVAIIYSAALKGAGDILCVLLLTAIASWLVMVLPSYICIVYFGAGVKTAFVFIIAYISVLGGGCYLRYRGGKWKHMRVIEPEPVQSTVVVDGPLVET